MPITSQLRRYGKRIPPIYWLGGLVNYLGFRRALRREQRAYAAIERPLSPPPMLRYRVHRALDEASYLANGKLIARTLAECARAHGVTAEGLTVLDFACGPGRVVGEMKGLTRNCRFHGSDIDEEAIAWARANLSQIAQFQTNSPAPPTRYPDGMFDLIYNVSLFTHLDEPSQNAWLAELARILKPGGTLLTTIHGRHTYASCTPEELRQLDEHGIAFRVDHKGRFKLDGLPDFYQTTFHAKDYVARVWGRYFRVVDHVEGGLGGHHDIVVLQLP